MVGEQKRSEAGWLLTLLGQRASAETPFAQFSIFRCHLRRVLACLKNTLKIDKPPIALHKVAVHLRRHFSGIQKPRAIDRFDGAIGRYPPDGIRIDLVPGIGPVSSAADLLDDPVALECQEKKPDHLVHLLAAERPARRDTAGKCPFQVAAIAAIR